jgi:hypothetical protein
MTQPKISLHDALFSIHEHMKNSDEKRKMIIKSNPWTLSPEVWVGGYNDLDTYPIEDLEFVINPANTPGTYEAALGFLEYISEPEKVEEVQKEETKVKKFVMFDVAGGWASVVSAESLSAALEIVTEDVAGDYDWQNGCSINVGEVVFEGTIKSVAVPNVVEDLDTEEEVMDIDEDDDLMGKLPDGAILESLIDNPVCIYNMKKGDLGIVYHNGSFLRHVKKCHDADSWLYGTGYSKSLFNKTWKILYTPPESKTETPGAYEAW